MFERIFFPRRYRRNQALKLMLNNPDGLRRLANTMTAPLRYASIDYSEVFWNLWRASLLTTCAPSITAESWLERWR